MGTTDIIESSPRDLQKKEFMPPVNMLYREFLGKTYIEKYKLEEFVVREIVRGVSIQALAKALDEKVPNTFSINTWRTDIEKFMERSDELLVYFQIDRKELAKRHIDAKSKIEEELAGLIAYTKKLIIEANNKGEISNSIAAINALEKIYRQYSLLTGFVNPIVPGDVGKGNQMNVLINIGDSKFDTLKNRANKADFKMVDITPPDIKDPLKKENKDGEI